MESPDIKQTPNTQHTHFPIIKTFKDVFNHQDELVRIAKEHPMEDHIYYFPQVHYEREQTGFGPAKDNSWWNCQPYGNIKHHEGVPPCVIAGSAALHNIWLGLEWHQAIHSSQVQPCPHCNQHTQKSPEKIQKPIWKPTDTDIFFLNAKKAHRSCIGSADFVYAPEKTVEELLLNFDLPCCRVAINPARDIWVSGQCLAAIFSKKYYLPAYVQKRDTFFKALNGARLPTPVCEYAEFSQHDRIVHRVEKYTLRGLAPVWVETAEILPWIKYRFHYAEWSNAPTAEATP